MRGRSIVQIIRCFFCNGSASFLQQQSSANLEYDLPMAKTQEPFDVGCPCCGALIKVDPATKAVIAHTAPVRPKTFNDFEEATRAMREQDVRRESLFQQSIENERNKADLMEKKFQEAVKRAKETPDSGKPLRDIDLG